MRSWKPLLRRRKMTDLDVLLARLDALEARIAILEAERASRQPPRMVYNWGREDYQLPAYEWQPIQSVNHGN